MALGEGRAVGSTGQGEVCQWPNATRCGCSHCTSIHPAEAVSGGGPGVVGGIEPRDLRVLQGASSLHIVPRGPAVLRGQPRVWVSIQYSLPLVMSQHTTPPPAPVCKGNKMWGKATAIRAALRALLEGQHGSPQPRRCMGTGCGERPWGQRGAVGQRATEVLCKPFCTAASEMQRQ